MLRVGLERVAVEILGEEPLAKCDAVFLAHFVEAGGTPDALGRFDDKRGGVVVEPISVRLEPAELGLFEREREGIEELVGAEPDEAAIAQVDGRACRWPRTCYARRCWRRRTR